MSAASAILIVALGLVTVVSVGLLLVVVNLGLRRSVTTGTAAQAMESAVRRAATELVAAVVAGEEASQLEAATAHLAGLLDIDTDALRAASRARRRASPEPAPGATD